MLPFLFSSCAFARLIDFWVGYLLALMRCGVQCAAMHMCTASVRHVDGCEVRCFVPAPLILCCPALLMLSWLEIHHCCSS